MEKTTRQFFNERFHFRQTAEDRVRCCRGCADFRRHPRGITFCHYLFQILLNQSESRVWGKSGCDRFKAAAEGEGK
jgi:hypothetical protein